MRGLKVGSTNNDGTFNPIVANQVDQDNVYKCDVCQIVVCSSHSLKRHKNIVHTNERPFSCEVCQKSFKTKEGRDEHQVVHNTERLFACSICPKSFKRKSGRTKHEKVVHTLDKPFACELCAKAYKAKANLCRHFNNVHSNASQMENGDFYSSNVLFKASKQTKSIKGPAKHSAIDKYEFSCKICNQSFQSKRKLKRHKKVHRKNQVTQKWTDEDHETEKLDTQKETEVDENDDEMTPNAIDDKSEEVNDGYEVTCSMM